jgi:phosphate transport system permease protein
MKHADIEQTRNVALQNRNENARASLPIKKRDLNKRWWTKRFRFGEFLAEKLITAVAFVSFAVILLIFVFVFREAAPIVWTSYDESALGPETLQQETYGEPEDQLPVEPSAGERRSLEEGGEGTASVENLLGMTWQPVSEEPKYGLVPLLIGSFKVTLVAILFAAPIAILAAVFTSTFAPKWAKDLLKPAIEILAGFPSVVIGFFALTVLATLLQDVFSYDYRLNAFVGGLAMSLAVIPIIYTIAEDSLVAVPKALTEASLALGASKWQTALFVVLPAATPGVFAAVLLGIGRAFGETMIVLMATGNAAIVSASLFEPVRTMSATIGAEMAEVVFGDLHYNVLFLIGSLLFVFTLSLNAIAEFYVRQRLLQRFRG